MIVKAPKENDTLHLDFDTSKTYKINTTHNYISMRYSTKHVTNRTTSTFCMINSRKILSLVS